VKLACSQDYPDPNFVDTNSDGLDGEVNNAIFVEPVNGSDSNNGSMLAPVRTIAHFKVENAEAERLA